MSNSFRIEASELASWHSALAARMELRGIPAIAKEIEAHLARKEGDGTVVVTRHQLFTWAEALQGAVSRDQRPASAGAALSLQQVVADMRAILSGKPAAATPPAASGAATYARAPVATLPAPALPYTQPPAVTYGAPAPSIGGARIVSGTELAATVRELIRGARSEVCISSPWVTGMETLVADVAALPPAVRVLIVSRRPDRDDGAFHQAMDQLGRRRAVTAFSNHIQSRLIIADGERALVGAASIPGPVSREVAVLITDRGLVLALRAQFEKAHDEAAGGAPRY